MKKYILCLIPTVALLIACAVYKSQLNTQIEINAKLTADIALAEQEKQISISQIKRQNEEIIAQSEGMELAAAWYSEKIATLKQETAAQERIIKEQLINDNSCQNQLRLISEQLEAFAMGGLR